MNLPAAIGDQLPASDFSNIAINGGFYIADTGAANAYVATTATPTLTALQTGFTISFKAANANTGSSTLNVNSLGAKTIYKNKNQTLQTGDILAGQMVTVKYDGTNFQLGNVVVNNFYFGSGSDGSYTLDGTQAAVGGLFSKASNTYTLLRDTQFVDLTINSGVTLECAGYILGGCGTLANAGTIQNNGVAASGVTLGAGATGNTLSAGTAGQTGAASQGGQANGNNGTVGTSKNPSLGVNGAAGATGGSSGQGQSGGTLGGAGTATSETATVSLFLTNPTLVQGSVVSIYGILAAKGTTSGFTLSPSAGSGSGSSGGSNGGGASSGTGGGSGGSGGVVEIVFPVITNTGSIFCKGGAGGIGGNANAGGSGFSGGGGGGAGGAGGIIVLIYRVLTVGTVTVSGGAGGAGGAAGGGSGSTTGGTGGTGTTGLIYKLLVV